jgi:hypothetical protein
MPKSSQSDFGTFTMPKNSSIKPRLQRLFTSKDIAKQMRWHKVDEKMTATLSNTRPIPLRGRSLIRNMTGLLVIPTTYDLVWQVMVSAHLVI